MESMTDETLKSGDLVKAVSGGRTMTVERPIQSMAGKPLIKCAWFAEGEVRKSSFRPETLVRVEH